MKTAVITGATGDIGMSISRLLHKSGLDIVALYEKNQQNADTLKAEIGAQIYKCNLASESDIKSTAKLILQNNKNIEVIVNCAGISKTGLVTDFSGNDFDEIFSVNVKGMFIINNCLLPQMIHNKSGNIINISSIWGETGGSCEVLYSATKGAIIAYTKALAKEVAPSGIRVNAVSPGFIDTKMNSHLDEKAKFAFCEDTPLERLGTPDDIANAVDFLCSEKASFITGEILRVNGGWLI